MARGGFEHGNKLIIAVAVIAIMANASVDRTANALPWEATLSIMCLLFVCGISAAAKKTELAFSVVAVMLALAPTYFVYSTSVYLNNWTVGTLYKTSTPSSELLRGLFLVTPNATRFDSNLPLGLSIYDLSLSSPNVELLANTSEILHSGIQLTDPLTKQKTHDYLLIESARKVKDRMEAVKILVKCPVDLEVWPKDASDLSLSLQQASGFVIPHLIWADVKKLEKGAAMEKLQKRHNLRPFMLDAFKFETPRDIPEGF